MQDELLNDICCAPNLEKLNNCFQKHKSYDVKNTSLEYKKELLMNHQARFNYLINQNG